MNNTTLKSRYIGNKPYKEDNQNLFFARNDETNKLFKLLYLEKIVVLHSKAGFGKTSLINAGLIPLLKKETNLCIYQVNLKKYDKSNVVSALDNLNLSIKKEIPNQSYINKIIEEQYFSLWSNFKKIQSKEKENKKHLIIIDKFENFLDYPQKDKIEFKEELFSLIFSQIPEKYRDSINTKLEDNPDLMTNNGLKKLYEELNIKLLFSVQTNKLEAIDFLKDKIYSVSKNMFELLAINKKQAKDALILPATFTSKYVSKNNFISPNFSFNNELIEKLIDLLLDNKNKEIDFFKLQIIGKYVEKLVVEKNIEKVELNDIDDIDDIFVDYYNTQISQIESLEQQKFAHNFIENELIFAPEKRALLSYSGIAKNNYKLTTQSIDDLIKFNLIKKEKDNDGAIFYKINNSIFIEPILKLKDNRIKQEFINLEELKQREELEKNSQEQELKVKRIRRLTFFFAIAFILSTSVGFFFWKQQKKAKILSSNSKSSTLASLAFKEINNDPTYSFRLAQKAYNLNNSNSSAYEALINSFYKTNVFYDIIGNFEEKIISASFSSDGNYILSIVNTESLNEFKVLLMKQNGTIVREFTNKTPITSANFSDNNKSFVITSWDSTAVIYDTVGNMINKFKGHNAVLWNASFSHDGTKIVTSGSDNKSVVWDVNGNKISELIGHELDVKFASFSFNDSLIVSSGNDNTIRIWNIEGEQIAQEIIYYETAIQNIEIEPVYFSPNDKYIIASVNDYFNKQSSVRLIDITGKTKSVYRVHDNSVLYANFVENEKQIIVTNKNNTSVIIDYEANVVRKLLGHKSSVINAQMIEDNQKVLTISYDGTIREWFLKKENNVMPEVKSVNFAKFTQTGVYIIKAIKNTVSLTDIFNNEKVVFKEHTKNVTTAQLSPDNKFIISAGKDKIAYIWDFNGNIINMLEHNSSINTAVFSPNMLFYLTANNDATAIVWDNTGQKITTINHKSEVNTAVFSPNQKYILTASNDSIATLYDIEGNEIQQFIGHKGAVTSASFSPNGKYIITTSEDETAMLWDLFGNNLITYKGYENKVNSASFSPDGNYIVTTSDDATARLWDLDGNPIMVLNHEGKVFSASYSPNGNYILSVYRNKNYDKKVKLWLVGTNEIINHIDNIKQYGTVWNKK